MRRRDGAHRRLDGELIRLVALVGAADGTSPTGRACRSRGTSGAAGAVARRRTVHVADTRRADVDGVPGATSAHERVGYRTRRRRAAAARGRRRSARSPSARRRVRPVHRQADRAAQDLRRPGGHRHRERAAVQGAGGAQPRAHEAGAADGDQRDPAGDQPARRPTCSRCSTRSCAAPCTLCGARIGAACPRSTASCRIVAAAATRPDNGSMDVATVRFRGAAVAMPRLGRAILRRARSSISRTSPRSRPRHGRAVQTVRARRFAQRPGRAACSASGSAIGAISVADRRRPGRSPTTRSRCSRPSPTRRSSPSRTCGCSRSWRRAIAI